jgi:hypothetical protein
MIAENCGEEENLAQTHKGRRLENKLGEGIIQPSDAPIPN